MVLSPSGKQTISVDSQNSESDEEEELDFQDDDSEALLLLLRIAHVQFVGIPKTLPYETLFPVAVLVDQYECAELIQPWVQNWLANEKSKSLELGKSKWLFIVWALGREAVLHELAGKCVNEVMHYGDQPNASSYDILKTNKFLKSPSPPLLIDQIKSVSLHSKILIELQRVSSNVASRKSNHYQTWYIKLCKASNESSPKACRLSYQHSYPMPSDASMTTGVEMLYLMGLTNLLEMELWSIKVQMWFVNAWIVFFGRWQR